MTDNTPGNASQIIIYQTESGQTKIEVRLEDETVWLTQKLMAELFQVSKSSISEHVKHILEDGELDRAATVRKFRTVQTEGTRNIRRELDYYNLDMIISVGYRVQSHVATRFRQWATRHIREYIVKGFVLDDERLKNPDVPFDYFDELLRRIQDIRTSEKRFYQKMMGPMPVRSPMTWPSRSRNRSTTSFIAYASSKTINWRGTLRRP